MKMLDYVLCDGRRDQLVILAKMYEDLMVNKEITTENIKQAHILGWCTEIVSFQFFFRLNFLHISINLLFFSASGRTHDG